MGLSNRPMKMRHQVTKHGSSNVEAIIPIGVGKWGSTFPNVFNSGILFGYFDGITEISFVRDVRFSSIVNASWRFQKYFLNVFFRNSSFRRYFISFLPFNVVSVILCLINKPQYQ